MYTPKTTTVQEDKHYGQGVMTGPIRSNGLSTLKGLLSIQSTCCLPFTRLFSRVPRSSPLERSIVSYVRALPVTVDTGLRHLRVLFLSGQGSSLFTSIFEFRLYKTFILKCCSIYDVCIPSTLYNSVTVKLNNLTSHRDLDIGVCVCAGGQINCYFWRRSY